MSRIDESWEILPVANPDLPERKRRRLIRESLLRDPLATSEPLGPVP